ncbi:hypothetical protein GCM10027575_72040 [Phytohabitans suffuscus]
MVRAWRGRALTTVAGRAPSSVGGVVVALLAGPAVPLAGHRPVAGRQRVVVGRAAVRGRRARS